MDIKDSRKSKLEALIKSHSKQNQHKMDFLNDSVHKKERKNTFGSRKKKASKTKENTMRSEKQWLSNRMDHHSQGRRRKRNQSNSIQNTKFKNKKKTRGGVKINSNEAEIKLSWLLRVREEMSMKHVQTYNFLKKWFGKIFINGSNSQAKFYRTFKQYLTEDENIFFLCFGQNKSGKTFSIQGNQRWKEK
jgi:hypothetical protein